MSVREPVIYRQHRRNGRSIGGAWDVFDRATKRQIGTVMRTWDCEWLATRTFLGGIASWKFATRSEAGAWLGAALPETAR